MRALRDNLSAYDAWYVAPAEALEWPLATLDLKLRPASGPACEFIVATGASSRPQSRRGICALLDYMRFNAS